LLPASGLHLEARRSPGRGRQIALLDRDRRDTGLEEVGIGLRDRREYQRRVVEPVAIEVVLAAHVGRGRLHQRRRQVLQPRQVRIDVVEVAGAQRDLDQPL
jgi:hypothetical protein